MIRYLSLALLLLLTSCIQLGAPPQPTRYYLLEPVGEFIADKQPQDLNIRLQTINFPSYLDRPQIVSRNQDRTFSIANHDRWAEPLVENFTRVVQENLSRALVTTDIATSTLQNKQVQPEHVLQITVNEFDGILGQQTVVNIRWSIFSSEENSNLSRGQFLAQLPIEDGYTGLVDGLNKAAAQFSQEITQQLLKTQEN